MSKKPIKPKKLRIISDFFTVKYGEDDGLRCQMRLDYNTVDGIQLHISKEKDVWLLHSCPFPGPVPPQELGEFIRLFKKSIKRFNPRAKFRESHPK